MKKIVIAGVLLFAIIMVLAITTGDNGGEAEWDACPAPTGRYTEEDLHRAYEMTRQMSSPEAAPMWDDEQLRRSLTDPQFVAELERHFCEMQRMLGRRSG